MASAPPGSPLQTYLHSGVTNKNEKKEDSAAIANILDLEEDEINAETETGELVEDDIPDLSLDSPQPTQGSNDSERSSANSLLQRRPVKPAMVDPLMSSSVNNAKFKGNGQSSTADKMTGGINARFDPLKSRLGRKSPRPSPKSGNQRTNHPSSIGLAPEIVNLFNGIIPQYRAAKFDIATVTKDATGLAILAENGCWREVVKLSNELIKRNTGTDTSLLPHMLLVIYNYRVAGLMKIGRYDQAQNLLLKIGSLDTPDKLYQSHSSIYSATRTGSMVPFNLHLLNCEIWRYSDRPQPQKTIEMLFALKIRVKRELDSEKIELYSESKLSILLRYRAVTLTLVKYYLQPLVRGQPNYYVACKLLKELIKEYYPKDSFLHAYVGRIYLQFGDTVNAQASFELAAQYKPDDKTNDTVMFDLNRASLMVAKGQYAEALSILSRLLKKAPDDPVVVNNYSVVALYNNQLCGAITALEAIIRTNPVKQMSTVHTATIIDNLKVFYELSGSKSSSVDMKKMLDDLIYLYAPDDLQPQVRDR